MIVKGTTINDLGGGGGNFQNEFWEPLPYKGLRNYFFLDFLRPHPQIITGRPLRSNQKSLLMLFVLGMIAKVT